MRPQSELELFQALGGREDADVLAELSRRLRRCVHWVLNRMPGGHRLSGEVEDIVGDARLRLELLRHRGFEGGAPEFRTYLYKVVVSACVEAANRQRWTASLDAPVALPDGEAKPLGDVLREMVDPHLRADVEVETAEEASRVRTALASLDGRCRSLLRRFHVEERPIKELARAEGARANTIEVALSRCRQRLYAAVLFSYVDGSRANRREQVTQAAQHLEGQLGEVFRAWWAENRSPTQISKQLGVEPGEARRLLARAKLEVWRAVRDAGAA
ncbi:MAG: sigma-70 family RNA polymerase sigma factor [Candidatus Rokubacteria bacterium]|nr:sigma-70 family RNA polymerase sigma factor [Candidatus Rokubacteria bacterium]